MKNRLHTKIAVDTELTVRYSNITNRSCDMVRNYLLCGINPVIDKYIHTRIFIDNAKPAIFRREVLIDKLSSREYYVKLARKYNFQHFEVLM